MSDDCRACIENRPTDFPGKKPKKAIPIRSALFLQCIDRGGRVLLERRPPTGIWGGLWSFPQIEAKAEVADWLSDKGLTATGDATEQSRHSHTFSHFKLEITPVVCPVAAASSRISDRDDHRWFTIDEALVLGLPAPVLKMLETLTTKD